MENNSSQVEMYEMIRNNRLAIYSKPRRYFNREGRKGSPLKFLFLVEVIVFLILAFAAGSVNAQMFSSGNILQADQSGASAITEYTTVFNSGKVFLNWSASNEQADCVYIIERSPDGVQFESVGVKEGIGTDVELFYSWMDNKPLEGFSYYRVKKITRDGTQFFSATNTVINQGTVFTPEENYAKTEQNTTPE